MRGSLHRRDPLLHTKAPKGHLGLGKPNGLTVAKSGYDVSPLAQCPTQEWTPLDLKSEAQRIKSALFAIHLRGRVTIQLIRRAKCFIQMDMPNECGFDDSFLAPPSDLIVLLAQLADERSSRRRVAALPHQNGGPISPALAMSLDKMPTVRRQKNCKCGQCKRCLENARWNRVFEEKFADPAYYGPVKIRHTSSLGGC